MLADEVGLGKTIGALMVLKEYIQRSMVKSALMLTPTPLVSQWKEEMEVKFGLNFPSTNDPGYYTREQSFWKEDFILASINLAKSKKNFPIVTQREYDIVIVDEAHYLKDRNTLNWKLINALKKRFLLLLTATPVENNLMELYNLVAERVLPTSTFVIISTRSAPYAAKNVRFVRDPFFGLRNKFIRICFWIS